MEKQSDLLGSVQEEERLKGLEIKKPRKDIICRRITREEAEDMGFAPPTDVSTAEQKYHQPEAADARPPIIFQSCNIPDEEAGLLEMYEVVVDEEVSAITGRREATDRQKEKIIYGL